MAILPDVIDFERLRVDRARLWRSLEAMAEVGGLPGGGCCRTALSEPDGRGRDLFVAWCREAGCEIGIDQVGNIHACRRGRSPDSPAVATGSHLDTQPHGGRFDGVYGVLAGLEVVRTLNDARIETDAPIDVIVWTNEEGARFTPPLTGSSAFIGKMSVPFIHSVETIHGTTVRADLEKIGYLGAELPGTRRLACFFEAHIEQGPILEDEGLTIGVVTRIQGIRFLRVDVTGEDGHAGTVPMDRRSDALVGAARMITALHDLALGSEPETRITVGHIEVAPNAASTIPGRVEFSVDLRHPDGDRLNALHVEIDRRLHAVADSMGLEVASRIVIDVAPVVFPKTLVETVRQATARLGYRHRDMLSGAGHDAMNLAKVVPTAMIFVPCKDGLSHTEAESAKPEDLAAGANVLLHALLTQALTGQTGMTRHPA